MHDYVVYIIGYAKFGFNGFLSPLVWDVMLIWLFLSPLVSWLVVLFYLGHTPNQLEPIFTINGSNDEVSPKDVPHHLSMGVARSLKWWQLKYYIQGLNAALTALDWFQSYLTERRTQPFVFAGKQTTAYGGLFCHARFSTWSTRFCRTR